MSLPLKNAKTLHWTWTTGWSLLQLVCICQQWKAAKHRQIARNLNWSYFAWISRISNQPFNWLCAVVEFSSSIWFTDTFRLVVLFGFWSFLRVCPVSRGTFWQLMMAVFISLTDIAGLDGPLPSAAPASFTQKGGMPPSRHLGKNLIKNPTCLPGGCSGLRLGHPLFVSNLQGAAVQAFDTGRESINLKGLVSLTRSWYFNWKDSSHLVGILLSFNLAVTPSVGLVNCNWKKTKQEGKNAWYLFRNTGLCRNITCWIDEK